MKMSSAIRNASCFVVWIVVVLALASSASAQTEKVAEGPCASVFGVKVCTAYRTRSGKVTEFSLSVPIAAIEQAPTNVPMVWPPKAELDVRFAPVVEEQTGFTFANIYWEAGGHPPAAYMVPHFDIHFYFVPEQGVQEIDCKDTTKPRTLPAGYTLPDVNVPPVGELVGLCVPAMGMHALPAADVNLQTPWQASLLIGYYAGKPMFIEPMIHARTLVPETFVFAAGSENRANRPRPLSQAIPRRLHPKNRDVRLYVFILTPVGCFVAHPTSSAASSSGNCLSKLERVTIKCARGQKSATVTKLSPKTAQNGQKRRK
jgi:hypothetical protein